MQTIPIRRDDGRAPGKGATPATGGATVLTSLPPLTVYVHVPWCVRKCPYCDFKIGRAHV